MARKGRSVGFVFLISMLLSGLLAIPANANASPLKKKSLSLSVISFVGPAAQSFTPEWVAESKGYLAQQGITAYSNTLNSGTVASWVAVLLSGAANFLQGAASGTVLAAQQGAPIRAVAMTSSPTGNEVNIESSFANAHGIPSKSATTAQVEAQIRALKGTHVSLAISTTTSDSFNWTVDLFRQEGLTVNFNSPTSDVNLVPVGSTANQIVAMQTGKTDGQTGTPPYTVQPNTITIPLFKVPPASKSAGQYLVTTTSMIINHPDTVQAVVTAVTEASNYIITKSKQAFRIASGYYSQFGYTDPATQSAMFNGAYQPFAYLSYPTKVSYVNEVRLVNGGQPTPLTLPWQDFVIPKFATAALKKLGLKLPKG